VANYAGLLCYTLNTFVSLQIASSITSTHYAR